MVGVKVIYGRVFCLWIGRELGLFRGEVGVPLNFLEVYRLNGFWDELGVDCV